MFKFKFNITLSEKETLALMEVINRADEIKHPKLMFYNVLLKLEKRLLEVVNETCCGSNKLNN